MPRRPVIVRSHPAAFRVLTPALLAGFGGMTAVLIATLVIGPANLRSVHTAGDAVAHTQAVKAALQQLLATAVDAETGQRGFIITGEASYLESYNRARESIAADIARVGALTADNRAQQDDLEALRAATTAKLGELADAIRQRRDAGFAAAPMVARPRGSWKRSRCLPMRCRRREAVRARAVTGIDEGTA
jgi:CHASE3 domain sensor protein